jgi:hypothetical protein
LLTAPTTYSAARTARELQAIHFEAFGMTNNYEDIRQFVPPVCFSAILGRLAAH